MPSTPQGFDSPDPTSRLRAIAQAGDTQDGDAVPDLIEQLESADPAARLLAIRALERITGHTHGYHHADPWWVRADAVREWKQWASASQAGSEAAAGPDSDE